MKEKEAYVCMASSRFYSSVRNSDSVTPITLWDSVLWCLWQQKSSELSATTEVWQSEVGSIQGIDRSQVKQALKYFEEIKKFAVGSMDLGACIKEKVSGMLRARSYERLQELLLPQGLFLFFSSRWGTDTYHPPSCLLPSRRPTTPSPCQGWPLSPPGNLACLLAPHLPLRAGDVAEPPSLGVGGTQKWSWGTTESGILSPCFPMCWQDTCVLLACLILGAL